MPPSASESGESAAFYLLNERIRRWIWEQGWTELRQAQEAAAGPILEGKSDVIIAAATASGKTEAAFLPLASRLLGAVDRQCVLYVSPLKALINDQFGRMEQLCERLDIPVHPWHGDICASRKKSFLKKPEGILLITPESLESLFVNHGHAIGHLFSPLAAVVVDEMHSFIGTERGCQLQSLLHRIEVATRRRIARIGLSATIGDMGLAAEYLRPGARENVEVIVADQGGQELRLLVRGFVGKNPLKNDGEQDLLTDENEGGVRAIGEALFQTLRGASNLVFANSRIKVETYADLLRRRCEDARLPNEFWPHHGSLSKDLREQAEQAIKDKSRPVTLVCTSTLEMGIDIGAVASIAQVGVAPSVASMRQRLGRSGRRGDPAVLRMYLLEREVTQNSAPSDLLRASLVQSIAMVRLLLAKWYEPPLPGSLHLSTLTQQILSLIAQRGGVMAGEAWQILCAHGPFAQVTPALFADVLRCLGQAKLIIQDSDGLLLHGELGERIVNHYSFYAAFRDQEEYRLVAGNKTLGTLPIDRPLSEGSFLIFGGRRWQVLSVDSKKKIVELKPAKGGKPPIFGGEAGWVHDRVREEMLSVYRAKDVPVFLDQGARDLLAEGRQNFERLGLVTRSLLASGQGSLLFCWKGDRIMDTLAAWLRLEGVAAMNEGIAITAMDEGPQPLLARLERLRAEGPIDPLVLAGSIQNKAGEKYDHFLSEALLCEDFARSRLDTQGAWKTIGRLLS